MNIQEGKQYKTRNGLITSPIEKSTDGTNYIWKATIQDPVYPTPSHLSWRDDGRFLIPEYDHRYDLIEEL